MSSVEKKSKKKARVGKKQARLSSECQDDELDSTIDDVIASVTGTPRDDSPPPVQPQPPDREDMKPCRCA